MEETITLPAGEHAARRIAADITNTLVSTSRAAAAHTAANVNKPAALRTPCSEAIPADALVRRFQKWGDEQAFIELMNLAPQADGFPPRWNRVRRVVYLQHRPPPNRCT